MLTKSIKDIPYRLIGQTFNRFHKSRLFMNSDDLYQVLGVNQSSTQSDIKKAYYKLAQQYHPDKNPSEEAKVKFNKIREAYDTLGEEQKRRVYDQTGVKDGQDPFGGGGGGFWGRGGQQTGQQFNEDIFDDFASFFNMDGQGRSGRSSKGADIVVNLDISFMESVNGVNKEIQFQKRGVCQVCKGSKCRPGTVPQKCSGCGGRGTNNYRQGPMTIQMTCNTCKGQGVTIKTPCTTCRGAGVNNQSIIENVKVPKGISNGQNLRVQGRGSQSEGTGPAGDLILKINTKSDPYFKRDNYDIYTDYHITLSEAILGKTVRVKTIYGEREIQIKSGTQHGNRYRLTGQGITKLSPHHDQKGDQIVVIKVVIPTSLDSNQRAIIEHFQQVESKLDPSINTKTSDEYEKKTNQQSNHKSNQRQKQNHDDFDEDDIMGKFRSMFR